MAYPISEDKKIQKITNILIKYAEINDIGFTFGGSELYPVEAFSDFGGLSLFLNEARETYQKLTSKDFTFNELMESIGNKNIVLSKQQVEIENEYLEKLKKPNFPIDYIEREDGTFFGFYPTFSNNLEHNFNFMVHLTFFSLEECIKKAKEKKLEVNKVPLDELYEKLVSDLSRKKFTLIKSDTPIIEVVPHNK